MLVWDDVVHDVGYRMHAAGDIDMDRIHACVKSGLNSEVMASLSGRMDVSAAIK
mgnify:CR=1 FL=1